MTCHIYLMRPRGWNLCKLGHSTNFPTRRQTLQSSSPSQLDVLRVLEVESAGVAAAFERIVRGWFPFGQAHGEWMDFGPHVMEAMDCIAPAVDVTDQFQTPLNRRAPSGYMTFREVDASLLYARFVDRYGWGEIGRFFNCRTPQVIRERIQRGRLNDAEMQRLRDAVEAPEGATQ